MQKASKIGFILLLSIMMLSFSKDEVRFQKMEHKGITYFIAAKETDLTFAPSFTWFANEGNISLKGMKQLMSDTTDIDSAESILKNNLSAYMLVKLQREDTTTLYYRNARDANSIVYEHLRHHARQLKSFITKDNKRFVYLDLFCDLELPVFLRNLSTSQWIRANDGGECFWRILIDLSDHKIIGAEHNGLG